MPDRPPAPIRLTANVTLAGTFTVDQLRAGAGSTGSADGADSASSGDNAADTHGPLRARLDAYVESAQERRAELARKLDMADEFIALLRST